MFRLIIFLFSIGNISAQSFHAPALLGVGNTKAAHEGIHSVLANPAGMARLETASIATNYQRHFLLADLYSYSFYTLIPTFKVGAVGLQFNQYTSRDLLQQTAWQLHYAYPLAKYWAIALGMQHRGVKWEDTALPSSFSFDLGLQYRRENLSIGALVKQLPVTKTQDALLPHQATELIFGANYLFSEQILLATDIFWEMEDRPELRTGLEYRFHRFFRLRGGVSSNPVQYYMGAGMIRKSVQVDIAASIHRELGMSPQIGLAYVF